MVYSVVFLDFVSLFAFGISSFTHGFFAIFCKLLRDFCRYVKSDDGISRSVRGFKESLLLLAILDLPGS